MTSPQIRAARSFLARASCIAALFACHTSLHAQSPVVFMTADINTPSLATKLVRFDSGTQTFAVSNGASPVYQGVTVLGGNVLVADYGDGQIQKFSPAGAYLGVFSTPTYDPVFLESDRAGNVYTAPDGLATAVAARINSAGVETQLFGGAGAFNGVDADALGNVYVAQTAGPIRNLLKFAPNGTLLNTTSINSMSPWDLAIDETGNRLFLADTASATAGIKIFDISGAAPSLIGSISTPANSFIFGVHYAAESGNILAVDSGDFNNDSRGLEYSPAGILLRSYRPTNVFHGNDITTLVPEPSCVAILLAGIFGLGLNARRARQR